MDNKTIIGIVVAILIIAIALGVYYMQDDKKKQTTKFSFLIHANDGNTGTLSPDGKKINWKTGGSYTRLTAVPSDPTILNDGKYVTTPAGKPASGAGDNLVNWMNDDIWPIKLVPDPAKLGGYKVYQNGGLSAYITNIKYS